MKIEGLEPKWSRQDADGSIRRGSRSPFGPCECWAADGWGQDCQDFSPVLLQAFCIFNPSCLNPHFLLPPSLDVMYIAVCSSWFQQTRLPGGIRLPRRLIDQLPHPQHSTPNPLRTCPTHLSWNTTINETGVVTSLQLHGQTSAVQQCLAQHPQ